MKTKLFAKLILSCLILANSVCAQTGNDSFSGRISIHEGDLFWAGATGATFENFDPTQMFAWRFGKPGSKWWSWTAPTTGFAALARHPDSTHLDDPPVFGVYSGADLPDLQLIDSFEALDSWVVHPSFVGFKTTAGETYSLGLAGESTNVYVPFLITVADSPIILEGPRSQSLIVGDTAVFFVVSPSLPAGHVQWQFKGGDIPNATNSALTLEKITLDQAGMYTAIVEATNIEGALKQTVTAPATLTVMVSGETAQPSIAIRNAAVSNQFFVKVSGQVQEWYRVESTVDFVSWQIEPLDFPVQSGGEAQLPLSTSAQIKFLRARHLGDFRDSCRVNLRKIEFAKELARIANHHRVGDPVNLDDLREYIGDIPRCPLDATYTIGTYATPPTCPWAALAHTLP